MAVSAKKIISWAGCEGEGQFLAAGVSCRKVTDPKNSESASCGGPHCGGWGGGAAGCLTSKGSVRLCCPPGKVMVTA